MDDRYDAYRLAAQLFIAAGWLFAASFAGGELLLRRGDGLLLVEGRAWYLLWLGIGSSAIALGVGIATLTRRFEGHLAGYATTIAWLSVFFGLLTVATTILPHLFRARLRSRVRIAVTEAEAGAETASLATIVDAVGLSWPVVQLLCLAVAVTMLGVLLVRQDVVGRRLGRSGGVLGLLVGYSVIWAGIWDAYYPMAYLAGAAVYAWAVVLGVRLLRIADDMDR